MNYTYLTIMLITVFVMSSCSKDKLEIPEANDPVFTIEGELSGSPLNLIAGDDGAYMFTMTKIVNGVQLFSGAISNGTTSVEIGVFDGSLDKPNHVPEIELSSIVANFAFNQSQPLAELSKYIFSNQSAISEIEWFANGAPIGSNSFATISEPGKYEVCAHITFVDLTTDILCDELIVGYTRSSNFTLDWDASSGYLNAFIDPVAGSAGINDVKWFVDGNFVSSNLNYQSSIASGNHDLSAEVTFSDGSKRRKNCLVNAFDQTKNTEDFTAFELQNDSVIQDYNVVLKINHNGQEFLSSLANNSDASLTINNVTYYGKNDAGKDVYKINADIVANVCAVGTTKQIPVSFTTNFGIEIP